jgi:galactonate dehydratase
VPLAPHNPNGPIATLATAHLLTAIPNALILETVGAPSDLARAAEIVDEPLVAVDGQVEVPARPGLGARLREGVASRFPAEPVGGYR